MKCKMCGMCPIQPLGICLFIWIAAILCVIVVGTAIYVKKKKKEENSLENEEENEETK